MELFRLYELPNYDELLQMGFITMKAECYRMYTEHYLTLINDEMNKYEAIRETASKFGVSRRTIYNYIKILE